MRTVAEILTLGLRVAEQMNNKDQQWQNYGSSEGMCVIVSRLCHIGVLTEEEKDLADKFLNKMMEGLDEKCVFIYLRRYLLWVGVEEENLETAWVKHYEDIINKLNVESLQDGECPSCHSSWPSVEATQCNGCGHSILNQGETA